MQKKLSSALLALGSILIFFSWVAQNYFEKKWENEFRRGQDIVNTITQETYMCDILLMEHDRLHNEKPVNIELLAKNSGKLAFTAANIMYLSDGMASKICKVENPSPSSADILEKVQLLTKQEKYIEIIKLCHEVLDRYDNKWKPPDVNFARMKLAYLKADYWNEKFLILYIIGSCIVGTGWILGRFKSEPQSEDTQSKKQLPLPANTKKRKHH